MSSAIITNGCDQVLSIKYAFILKYKHPALYDYDIHVLIQFSSYDLRLKHFAY